MVVGLLQVKGMLTDFGDDMHCQFLEIIRSLLDSFSSGGQVSLLLTICQDDCAEYFITIIKLVIGDAFVQRFILLLLLLDVIFVKCFPYYICDIKLVNILGYLVSLL